jgi:hypothetical protein
MLALGLAALIKMETRPLRSETGPVAVRQPAE